MMRHCLLNGNAYAVIEWDKSGEPLSLTPYPPSAVNIQRKADGSYIYQITDLSGKVKTYLQDEILHLRHSSDDGFIGRSADYDLPGNHWAGISTATPWIGGDEKRLNAQWDYYDSGMVRPALRVKKR
ncbi:phage portal protein, HK97 family [Pasteurella testudinis]|nr:phage portal protein, HK97 family [Pasteurella testudinis]